VTSTDPTSLKKNRLGSVMLRSENLWDGGSLTALYSPKLDEHTRDAAFSPDFGATTNRDRWLLAYTQSLPGNFNPQWIMYGQKGKPAQFGLNVSRLVNDASVAFVEWSGGRSRSQLSEAIGGADDSAFRNRVAAGLTYTTDSKISMTFEYDYNGLGLSGERWDALRQGSPAIYGQYRSAVSSAQNPVGRQSYFFLATLQDAVINHLDLSAIVRANLDDHSRLNWLEARYHWNYVDLALQFQTNSGSAKSEYGALPRRRSWQAMLQYYY
jgi:hypothetical protein